MSVPEPLAVDGQVTHDPASRSLLVKVSGLGGVYWRRGHAALMQAETPGSVFEFSPAAATVWAHGARGEPVQDGWLRFQVDDATYRELAGEGLCAIVTVDRKAARILGVKFIDRSRP